MRRKAVRHLTWWDLVSLTVILFGQAIYSSNQLFVQSAGQGDPGLVDLSADQTYAMLAYQAFSLLLALAYLWFRRFDISQWRFKVSLRQTLVGLLLFVVLAGLMDLLYLVVEPTDLAYYQAASFDPVTGFKSLLAAFNLPIVLYSLLNGVYEELYFLGLCLAVKKEWRPFSWIFSILVRISFHTYQGLLPALGIGLILGIGYYVWYEKLGRRNLYPIFLSHALADIIGLSLLRYFLV